MTIGVLVERDAEITGVINWCWQFHAILSPETSLRALRRHGERLTPTDDCQPPFMLPDDDPVLREGVWNIVDRNDQYDSDPFGSDNISSDLIEGGHCTTYRRYHAFLVHFRSIIESQNLTAGEKRHALQDWFAQHEYPDVIYTLGGPAAILDRYLPSFLLSLNDQGLTLNATQALRLAGIDSLDTLGRIDESALADITRFRQIEWELLLAHKDRVAKAVQQSDAQLAAHHLSDPFVQLLY